MRRMEQGFTLIEMLVSVAIFAFIMVGVYYFFDAGRWMYLHSQNRSNLQENGRLAIENMEREMRMIGLGVPSGTEITTNATFNPAVIYGTIDTIGFRGDVDSYNSLVTADISTGDTSITLPSALHASFVCPDDGTPILIVDSNRKYEASTCTTRSGSSITIPGAANAVTAAEAEVFSPIHVFYRLTPDANGDGICDHDTDTAPDYTQCLLERAEERSNVPLTAPSSDDLWQTYATNVQKLNFTYLTKTSSGPASLGNDVGTTPYAVDMIRVLITVKDRAAVGNQTVGTGGIVADRVQQYQTASFTTDVLIRKHRY